MMWMFWRSFCSSYKVSITKSQSLRVLVEKNRERGKVKGDKHDVIGSERKDGLEFRGK